MSALYHLGIHRVINWLRISVDTWAFVNDHYALLIGELVDLLCVRVVRGAERVGARPADQVEVFHPQHRIPTSTSQLRKYTQAFLHIQCLLNIKDITKFLFLLNTYVGILVHAKPAEINRLAVDRNAGVCPLDSPNTNFLIVSVNDVTIRISKWCLEESIVQRYLTRCFLK